MLRTYRHCPISEAIFEFAPAAVHNWQDATPRYLSRAAEAAGFTVKEDIQVSSATFNVGPGGVSPSVEQSGSRTRMWRPERDRMFQYGKDLCAFNALQPYSSYAAYVPEMRPLVEEYVGSARPTGVRFLGQRYINQILLPDEGAAASEFFNYYPKLGGPHVPFITRIQVGEVQQGTCVASLAYAGLDAGTKPTYILDLYVRTNDDPDLRFDWGQMQTWQDEAHQAIIRSFEASITDKCRELFDPEVT